MRPNAMPAKEKASNNAELPPSGTCGAAQAVPVNPTNSAIAMSNLNIQLSNRFVRFGLCSDQTQKDLPRSNAPITAIVVPIPKCGDALVHNVLLISMLSA